jgi:OmcA/MtrC family decaheme c-type cytochrome
MKFFVASMHTNAGRSVDFVLRMIEERPQDLEVSTAIADDVERLNGPESRRSRMKLFRSRFLILIALVTLALVPACSDDGDDGNDGAQGPQGDPGPAGPPGDPGSPVTSIEGCEGCHGAGQISPVGDITLVNDAHAIDTDPDGPLTDSGYRQINAVLSQVDVRGASVVIDFDAVDETGAGIDNLLASDGRFAIDRIDAGIDGDPNSWVGIGDRSTENFTSGLFEDLTGGAYRYTSAYDPTGIVATGDSLRVSIQLSAGDLPAENAWCDFDADLAVANDCVSGTTLTRDIVQTADCNTCHGTTSDTHLSFHGGGRTDVEYCVACHNPTGNTDFTLLVHKIHAGAELANGFREYSDVHFTKDLDDCAVCHTGGGVDVDNWKNVPYRESCGSCHDDVNFDTGVNHGAGAVQPNNLFCTNCHPPDGPLLNNSLPVATVHRGGARVTEAATYQGGANGYAIESLTYSSASDEITATYSVTKSGSRMDLATADEWMRGGSLNLRLSWDTSEYSNVGSGSTPAQPISVNALDIGGAVTAIGGNLYEAVLTPLSSASDTVTIHLEGRPVADLVGDDTWGDRIPIPSVLENVDIEGGRSSATPRRTSVDATLCNQCHDSGDAGLTIHGTNRVSEIGVCVVCHNPDATDINRRPADPSTTPDGKREEAVDFKRMIHQIHAGSDLQDGLVIYGFGGTPHEYGTVHFIGNLENCETCHVTDAYSTEDARAASPSTIDTGADVAVPTDDLNISSTAAVCSSCHDDTTATDHMKLYGASFEALDSNIR